MFSLHGILLVFTLCYNTLSIARPCRIFLEETSLVARPAIGFEDLKQRMDARLKWLGIKARVTCCMHA